MKRFGQAYQLVYEESRPARGAWIETIARMKENAKALSRPARGAWIETTYTLQEVDEDMVAPRTGRVD
ncbi:hypothetical protein HMPREF9162_2204 [Selenomonas sp. oral taxon 137 str. F0430]|nr:hypothetical protein HMPREF9162_2204 [Selenomonas sp. oral taxon 137 str. F0430]